MLAARKHLGFSLRAKTIHEPLRAMPHIPHAINWMLRAHDEYARAVELLERTTIIMEALPETVELPVAAKVLSDIQQRLGEVGIRLAELAAEIDQRSKDILEDAETAAAEGRPILGDPVRPIPPRRLFVLASLSEALKALLNRRQRSNAAASEDAPRKVSRGRAPPLLSACPI
jgi:uncharacterized membrane protein YccC